MMLITTHQQIKNLQKCLLTQNQNDFNIEYGIYSNINGQNIFYTKIKISKLSLMKKKDLFKLLNISKEYLNIDNNFQENNQNYIISDDLTTKNFKIFKDNTNGKIIRKYIVNLIRNILCKV